MDWWREDFRANLGGHKAAGVAGIKPYSAAQYTQRMQTTGSDRRPGHDGFPIDVQKQLALGRDDGVREYCELTAALLDDLFIHTGRYSRKCTLYHCGADFMALQQAKKLRPVSKVTEHRKSADVYLEKCRKKEVLLHLKGLNTGCGTPFGSEIKTAAIRTATEAEPSRDTSLGI